MTIRKNISISEELARYFEEKSKATGISQSALMVMAMSEYLDQKKAMNSMNEILEHLKKLEHVKK